MALKYPIDKEVFIPKEEKIYYDEYISFGAFKSASGSFRWRSWEKGCDLEGNCLLQEGGLAIRLQEGGGTKYIFEDAELAKKIWDKMEVMHSKYTDSKEFNLHERLYKEKGYKTQEF